MYNYLQFLKQNKLHKRLIKFNVMKKINPEKRKLFLFICSIYICIISLFLLSVENVSAQEDLDVLMPKRHNTGWLKSSDAPNSLYHHLTEEGYSLLNLRSLKLENLFTPEEWKIRQDEIRQILWDIAGAFSEKTPLNAKVTGKIKKKGYSVENIIYESLPGFYVTASLFLPEKIQKPAPAILFCSGHSAEAYRREYYQLPLLNLVKKGFVVLAIDPIGQGERLQYFDKEKGESVIGSSTKEHSYPSPQVALIGKSVARYFAWDGIRGIDYLVSRKEVDATRIGVHGLSGGGTQTAYISALDDRVTASAPAGYITSYRRLMESIGVQDGEQNFYHGIVRGIDHPDYIIARAPKPTLIMATTRDFFSIQGARETYEDLKKIYTFFGKPENIEITEDDYVHGYTEKNREAMYAFFQKHLMLPGSAKEEEVDFLTVQELQKTSTGQLSTSLGGETVFSCNLKEAKGYIETVKNSRNTNNINSYLTGVVSSAKLYSGFRSPSYEDQPVFAGRYQREDYNVEKYFIKGEGDYFVPYLLLVPEKANDKAVIYLHPSGKATEANIGGEMELFVKNGFTVLAPDLIGQGELGPGVFKGDAYIENVSYNVWYTAMLIGRSIVGIQAADVIKLSELLLVQGSVNEVYGVARKENCPILMHAAAFSKSISRVALIEPYSSYTSIVENRFYKPSFVHSIVPGALKAYDLPDITAAIAPGKLLIAGVTDCNGEIAGKEYVEKELEIITKAYRSSNAENQLTIVPGEVTEILSNLLMNWVK